MAERVQGRKAVPSSGAATENISLSFAAYCSRRKRFAPSSVVMPARRNSCGSLPCQVRKPRSLRPRACGEGGADAQNLGGLYPGELLGDGAQDDFLYFHGPLHGGLRVEQHSENLPPESLYPLPP